MAGIYIHIPFCKKKCNYCDFYSVCKTDLMPSFIDSLIREINLRKDYLNNEIIETVYIGGGTPSLLEKNDFSKIFHLLSENFHISEKAEITIEVNPDDIREELLILINELPINRVSIGVQSFFNHHLQFLGRRHNADQCITAIKKLAESGIRNISIDLIYGIPEMTYNEWRHNLNLAFSCNIQHISAYHLSVEEGTPLGVSFKNKEFHLTDEEESWRQFEYLNRVVEANNWECYEISNFSKPGYHSVHNANYWKGVKYIGLGPSAHSYDQLSRQWNISDIKQYIHSLTYNILPFEKESLNQQQKYNEYVMTTLRTKWGTDLLHVKNVFGEEYCQHITRQSAKYLNESFMIHRNNVLILTTSGMFLSDKIFTDLIK